MKKKQVVYTILFSLMISAAVVISFLVFASYKEDAYPFDQHINMAVHNDAEVLRIDDITPNQNGEITIDQLRLIEPNTMLGTIEYNGNEVQVIYDCNDVTLIEAATLTDKGCFIGEIGCAKIYGYMSNMKEIMAANIGDSISISTIYGDYKYECVDKIVANSDWDVSRKDFDLNRGLIICSDRQQNYGFNNQYDILVMKMISGPKVVG